MILFKNRLRLMKQHFVEQLDADIIGISEVDGSGGEFHQAYFDLVKMMGDIGYFYEYFEKTNHLSGSAVFYKKDKFKLVQSRNVPYSPGASQSFMECVFELTKKGKGFQFVFCETHMKAKPENMAQRTESANVIVNSFADSH